MQFIKVFVDTIDKVKETVAKTSKKKDGDRHSKRRIDKKELALPSLPDFDDYVTKARSKDSRLQKQDSTDSFQRISSKNHRYDDSDDERHKKKDRHRDEIDDEKNRHSHRYGSDDDMKRGNNRRRDDSDNERFKNKSHHRDNSEDDRKLNSHRRRNDSDKDRKTSSHRNREDIGLTDRSKHSLEQSFNKNKLEKSNHNNPSTSS